MTDAPTETPASQPATAAEQPAGTQAAVDNQSTAPQFDPAEIASWKRSHEMYTGARPILDVAIGSGAKTPQELQARLQAAADHKKLLDTLDQRGMTTEQLMSLLGPGQPAQAASPQAGPEPLTRDSLMSLLDERDAESTHTAAERDQERLVMEAAKRVAGDGASDEMVKMASALVRDQMSSNRLFYPAGHPLEATSYRPYGEKDIKSIESSARTMLDTAIGRNAVQQAEMAAQPGAGRLDGGGESTKVAEGETADFSLGALKAQASTNHDRIRASAQAHGPIHTQAV